MHVKKKKKVLQFQTDFILSSFLWSLKNIMAKCVMSPFYSHGFLAKI